MLVAIIIYIVMLVGIGIYDSFWIKDFGDLPLRVKDRHS